MLCWLEVCSMTKQCYLCSDQTASLLLAFLPSQFKHAANTHTHSLAALHGFKTCTWALLLFLNAIFY